MKNQSIYFVEPSGTRIAGVVLQLSWPPPDASVGWIYNPPTGLVTYTSDATGFIVVNLETLPPDVPLLASLTVPGFAAVPGEDVWNDSTQAEPPVLTFTFDRVSGAFIGVTAGPPPAGSGTTSNTALLLAGVSAAVVLLYALAHERA